jgi:hypothetical protein
MELKEVHTDRNFQSAYYHGLRTLTRMLRTSNRSIRVKLRVGVVARVVGMIPLRVVGIVPVVEMVPVRVVEIVPLFVVDIVPLFGKAAVEKTSTKSAEQRVHFRVFILSPDAEHLRFASTEAFC